MVLSMYLVGKYGRMIYIENIIEQLSETMFRLQNNQQTKVHRAIQQPGENDRCGIFSTMFIRNHPSPHIKPVNAY